MFSIAYPNHSERQVYAQRAHRMRGAAVASLVREIARLVSVAAPIRIGRVGRSSFMRLMGVRP